MEPKSLTPVFFLFLISLIHPFSISMTALPSDVVAGLTYETQFTINGQGPTTTDFYFTLTGVNASNEINVSMDEANCTFNNSVWNCTGYSKPSAGSYQTKMYIHLNELLDTTMNYTWKVDYFATENVPATATTSSSSSSYSSTGGASFSPRVQPAPQKQTPPVEQPTTPLENKPPEQIATQPQSQSDTPTEPGLVNTSDGVNYSSPIILPIEIINTTKNGEETKSDYLLPAIIIGVVVTILIIIGVYIILKRQTGG